MDKLKMQTANKADENFKKLALSDSQRLQSILIKHFC